MRPRAFLSKTIAELPGPGLKAPHSFSFSQDDRQATYLLADDEQGIQQLYALDTATGASTVLVAPPGGGVKEDQLSPEEELRRQRQRMLATGITQYSRAKHAERLLIPLSGNIYVKDGPRGDLRLLVDNTGKEAAITPKLAPDGEWIAFVRDAELYVLPASGGEPRQITSGARGTGKTHGLAEYVAQEELDRHEGFWWSRDGRSIAYAEVDETHILVYVIPHQGSDITGPEAQEEHHYPFAGGPNALVRLAVVAREGGEPIWMDLDFGEEIYIARVFWWLDGDLGAVILNRPQTAVFLVRFDPDTGRRRTVHEERSDYWINLPRRCMAQIEDGGFIWASERTGFRHLYYYGPDGTQRRALTKGEWIVDEIAGVDERRGLVYLTGNREDPREKHLYAIGLDGGDVERLTGAAGTHEVTLDADAGWYVDVHSAIDTPPTVTLRALPGGTPAVRVPLPADSRLEQFRLEPPELVTLRNRESTLLYGALYRPPASFGPGPHPAIVHVYGGPHAQEVTNSWGRMTAALDIQYLRALGFVVFRLDNRGSARRGLSFEAPLRHQFGRVEVEDQVDGVRWLVDQGLADAKRVGIFGWSYGGYMTLMCLAKAPEVFKVGVAGAPVTDQAGYDTAYSERYLATPQTNPDGYRETSVLTHARNIRGKLLLVHGLLDENVHFRHTARLINVLTRAGIPYDIALFPDERHMPRHYADRRLSQRAHAGLFPAVSLAPLQEGNCGDTPAALIRSFRNIHGFGSARYTGARSRDIMQTHSFVF